MSILDTFGDEDSEVGAGQAAELGLSSPRGSAEPVPAVDGRGDASEINAPGADVAQVAPRKRGRPSGTLGSRLERQAAAVRRANDAAEERVAIAEAASEREAKSRRDKCRDAANARWAMQRADVGKAKQSESRSVPMHSESAIVLAAAAAESSSGVESWLPKAYSAEIGDRMASATWTHLTTLSSSRKSWMISTTSPRLSA